MNLAQAADLLLATTAVAYACASAAYFARLAGRTAGLVRAGKPLLAGGALLHSAHFVLVANVARACPVQGIHSATSVLGAGAAWLFLVATTLRRSADTRRSLEIVGAFIAPFSLATLLAARFIGMGDPAPTVRSAILPVHVTSVLLAVALFTVASALAATYLLQEKQLKQKKLSGLFQRLPPLDVLDRVSHRFLLAGFPLLTLGIVTGLVWIGRVGADGSQVRQVLTYAAWLFFAGVLFMRSAGGWRGRRAAWGTLIGFGCAVLVFLVYLVRTAHGHTPQPGARSLVEPAGEMQRYATCSRVPRSPGFRGWGSTRGSGRVAPSRSAIEERALSGADG
jgi:ABC-type uncharacterized transport system permease subunit